MIDIEHEYDPEILRQVAMLLDAENQRLHAKVRDLVGKLAELEHSDSARKQLELELGHLQEMLAQRNHALFGDKSERRPRTERSTPERPPAKPHGRRPQPSLRALERIWELDEPDEVCPKCGGELAEMKDQFEESEEIDVVQRQFVVVKHKRKKYRCSCNACIETAPGPLKLRPGNRYSVDFGIEVAVAKYLDHLPLERQTRMMRRDGLEVVSSSLWDQINTLAKLLEPAHDRLHELVLQKPVIGADETFWRLMDKRGNDKGVNKRWHVWSLCADDAVVYRILDSRSTAAAAFMLREYDGVVMADGYTAYESLLRKGGRYKLANCWAHPRRKFLEVEKFFPTEVAEILDLIGELYGVERQCPTGPPDDPDRLAFLLKLRQEKSKPIVRRIQNWAMEQRVLPQSGLGRGITYMTKIWKGLTRFLEDPQLPLDNNATERALRGVVVGRKNHYGSKSRRGTEVAALFYSLLETAKLTGVEPKSYLRRATLDALNGDPIPLPFELG